jgi:hypothetical protein
MVMLSASVIVEARRRAELSQREFALRLGKRQVVAACGRLGARVLGTEWRRASLDATEFVGQWCVK